MKRSLATPFAIGADVNVVSGSELDRSKVLNVLLTEPDELPWRTAFGTPLDALRHRPNDAVHRELVRVRCEDALATWIPSLAVVVTAKAGDDTSIVLRVAVGAADAVEVER